MDCDLWQKYESHHEVLECEMAEWKNPIRWKQVCHVLSDECSALLLTKNNTAQHSAYAELWY
jgi:hypothetical protein